LDPDRHVVHVRCPRKRKPSPYLSWKYADSDTPTAHGLCHTHVFGPRGYIRTPAVRMRHTIQDGLRCWTRYC
jgi:hypothetical protein